MAYGLKWYNNAGSQAISNEKYGLVYIGQATYAGTAQPDYYSQVTPTDDGGTYGSSSGRSTMMNYVISSPTPPIAFIQGAGWGGGVSGTEVALCSIANIGGTNWNIVIANPISPSISQPVVKCFARLSGPGVSGGWGMRVYDANGSRTWDSNERMLVVSQKLDFPAYYAPNANRVDQSSGTLNVSNPFIMVTCETTVTARKGTYVIKTDSTNNIEYGSTWSKASGGIMTRRSDGLQLGTIYYEGGGSYVSNFTDLPAARMYIIDGDKYN